MGQLVQLDFSNKQIIDQCIQYENTKRTEETDIPEKENDLIVITIKLTNRIKNSFRLLANFEKMLIEEIAEDDLGQYVGWDSNKEHVFLYISGDNTVALTNKVLSVLESLGLNSETAEILSYLNGVIPLNE